MVVDGNDQVWISNFGSGGSITHLCGARNETCPPGMKTGDPISPPGGYVGGGMQSLTDIAVDPACNWGAMYVVLPALVQDAVASDEAFCHCSANWAQN